MKKSFGLQLTGPKKKCGIVDKSIVKKPNSGFILDEDDNDDDNSVQFGKNHEIQRVNKMLSKPKEIDYSLANNDPSIYDYDGQYDSFSVIKEEKLETQLLGKNKYLPNKDLKDKEKDHPKSQYITNLKSIAEIREKEKERVYERKLLKDRLIEDEKFGSTEKFVTSAYKQKLMENKKWELQDRLTEEVEKKTDVRSQGMQGFYSNLLTKNVALGSDVNKSAVSLYTAGSNAKSIINNVTENETKNEYNTEILNNNLKRKIEDNDDLITNKKIVPTFNISNNNNNNNNNNNKEININSENNDKFIEKEEITIINTEKLLSAKERYLARKNSALVTTTINP